ncbi:MAG: DNA translocase FtsK [Verrucomicrobiaceae bacterium]
MPNPFLDDITTDPRREAESVAGLNDRALDALVEAFETLVAQPLPRTQEHPVKAQLVLSVEPGYGKSHLIARLFKRLHKRGTLVYLRPFVSPEACWRSLLHRTVQELNYPEGGKAGAPSQLDAFACGVLTHLVASLIERGTLPAKDVNAAVTYLRRHPLDAFGLLAREHTWSDWLRVVIPQSYDALAGMLELTGLPTRERLAWLRILFTLVLKRDHLDLRNACMDWIAAMPIDDDMRQAIGLSAGDVAQQEDDNEACRRRLVALGCLAGYYRPFVFCFDQTDAYADNPALAKAFSNVAEFLLAEVPHQITVVTSNSEPWEKGIEPHFQDAQKQRFRSPPLSLEGIDLKQARGLIQLRLTASETGHFPQARGLDDAWLERTFQGRPEMAVRKLLREAARRWEDEDTGAEQSLQERFHSLVQRHLDPSSDLCRFNAEMLWWFVHEAAHGQCGLTVSRHEESSYFTVRWQWETKVRLFGFEGGANARRWSAIANHAWELDHRNLGIRVIMLRTPELPVVPARTWTATRQQLEAARGKFLDIYVFGVEEIAQIHAARTLLEEAVAGDIPFPKKKALDFIHGKLRPVWEKLKSFPAPESATDSKPAASSRIVSVSKSEDGDGAGIATRIEQAFASFNLSVEVIDCISAPQLLRYRLQPADGVRVVALAARAKDLQVALGLQEPPIIDAAPGHVTVDIPRPRPTLVMWADMMSMPGLRDAATASPLAFPVGLSVTGEALIADLASPNTCHMLVGGTSGSGKSEFLKSAVASLASRNTSSALKFSIVDPKVLTFGGISASPWLANPVLTTLDDALILLRQTVEEMEQRYQQLAAENLMSLRERFDKGRADLPFRVIIFDEYADLILSGKAEKKEFESLVARIAAKGRAAGIHLILATQRPDRTIVTGLISANLPMKVCLRVTKDTNSRIILGEGGGEALLGRGDMLCDLGRGIIRCQSPIISQDDFLTLMRKGS